MIICAEFAHDYLVALHEVGEHDDDGDVLLPDHAPEVVERADERALRRDELAPRVVALSMSTTISAMTSYMYLPTWRTYMYEHTYTCTSNRSVARALPYHTKYHDVSGGVTPHHVTYHHVVCVDVV